MKQKTNYQKLGGSFRNVHFAKKNTNYVMGGESGTFSGHLLNAVRNACQKVDSSNSQGDTTEKLNRKTSSLTTENEKISEKFSQGARVQFIDADNRMHAANPPETVIDSMS